MRLSMEMARWIAVSDLLLEVCWKSMKIVVVSEVVYFAMKAYFLTTEVDFVALMQTWSILGTSLPSW